MRADCAEWWEQAYSSEHRKLATALSKLAEAEKRLEASTALNKSCGQWDDKQTCSVAEAAEAKLAAMTKDQRREIFILPPVGAP